MSPAPAPLTYFSLEAITVSDNPLADSVTVELKNGSTVTVETMSPWQMGKLIAVASKVWEKSKSSLSPVFEARKSEKDATSFQFKPEDLFMLFDLAFDEMMQCVSIATGLTVEQLKAKGPDRILPAEVIRILITAVKVNSLSDFTDMAAELQELAAATRDSASRN